MYPAVLSLERHSRREGSSVRLLDSRNTGATSRIVVLLAAVFVVLGAGLETNAVRAQDQTFESPPLRTVGPYAPPRNVPSSGGLSPRFRALLGGAIGVGAGVPLGLLLIRASRDESTEFGVDDEAGARLGVGLLGVFALVGGGPIGAVQALGGGEATTYAGAVVGELLVGGAGLALGSVLGSRTDSRQAWSLALGMPLAAVGAAGGAVLEGNGSGRLRSAVVARSRDGTWRLRVPDVHIAPAVRGQGAVSAHATLVRIRF
jgi:hypothetical protein